MSDKPEATEADVRLLRDWLKSKGVKSFDEESDPINGASDLWFYLPRAVRYSRMKFGDTDLAFAALSALLWDADDEECFVWTNAADVFKAMFDAGGYFERLGKNRNEH